MKKLAVVEVGASRIESQFDLDDKFTILPVTETFDEPGEDQMIGPPVVTVSSDSVLIHHPALRALTGVVAILGPGRELLEVRDLGSDPIFVADNVMRFREENSQLDPERQVRGGYEIHVKNGFATRVWQTRDLTDEELAVRAAERATDSVTSKFGELGLKVAFEQENRLRTLEGRATITMDEFIAEKASA